MYDIHMEKTEVSIFNIIPIVLNHNQLKWIYCLHDNVAVRPYRQPLTRADGCLPAPETLLGGSPYG